jgi:hypothetical protein
MPIDVDHLRRRAPGERLLIYLDQSTLSHLARDEGGQELLNLLREGVRSGRCICPKSDEHDAETMLAVESWEQIDKLADELALGVRFEDPEMIEWYEIIAASAEFLGRAPEREVWQEAFRSDPQAPLEQLFPGGFRIQVTFPPTDALRAEVEHLKRSEGLVASAYETARAAERTFEQQAELEFDAMLRWKLGLLFISDEFDRRLAALTQEAALEMLLPGAWEQPGSAYGRYAAMHTLKRRAESFLEHFPELRERLDEFRHSEALASVPSLRYPTLLRAGLAVMRERRPKPGDPYDIAHLTRGLSRCDLVTADSGMAQLCRERRLVPEGCELFSSRELGTLKQRLIDRLGD